MRSCTAIVLSTLLIACSETKVVGTIQCDASNAIDVVSVKYPRKAGYAQHWGYELRGDQFKIPIHPESYPGFLPPRFKRTAIGQPPKLQPDQIGFPHGEAFNFFLGEVPESRRGAIEACLLAQDKKLRALLLETKRLKQFPPKGSFDDRFVYWRGGPKDISLAFKSGETELVLSSSGTIYFFDRVRDKFLTVGKLRWAADQRLQGIEVDLSPRKNLGAPGQTFVISQTDLSKYLYGGEDLSGLLQVPYVAKAAPK